MIECYNKTLTERNISGVETIIIYPMKDRVRINSHSLYLSLCTCVFRICICKNEVIQLLVLAVFTVNFNICNRALSLVKYL